MTGSADGVRAAYDAAAAAWATANLGADAFAAQVLSAMRLGFGGHVEKK